MIENKHQSGNIDKISDVGYNKCYIGSTVESLASRMSKHRNHYQRLNKGCSVSKLSVFILFDEFGVSNCKIELLEHHPCSTREELCKREGYHIKNTDCVNKMMTGRTREQYIKEHRQERLDYASKYRTNNKDKLAKYVMENRNKHIEYMQNYYTSSIQREKERKHQWRLENAEMLHACISCGCGGRFTNRIISNHLNINNHKDDLRVELLKVALGGLTAD